MIVSAISVANFLYLPLSAIIFHFVILHAQLQEVFLWYILRIWVKVLKLTFMIRIWWGQTVFFSSLLSGSHQVFTGPGTLVAQEHNGEYGIGKYFAVRGTTVG
jgi:hypothetical protein